MPLHSHTEENNRYEKHNDDDGGGYAILPRLPVRVEDFHVFPLQHEITAQFHNALQKRIQQFVS